ncbi:hypothetical protein F511_09797 [Dorcoceras hygrometricum]|uniref:Uncharacterized protein n=1 Tax=Dorcoceras hygrometricum TaxID=472368 RepID=A0A2Z7C0D1_9LAMI|nr:hypothetical protein F511_09797 [Dorcoceras hygrometricum]
MALLAYVFVCLLRLPIYEMVVCYVLYTCCWYCCCAYVDMLVIVQHVHTRELHLISISLPSLRRSCSVSYQLTADCDLRLALQLNFLQLHLLNSNHLLIVMTSSLLLIASSRMYADVITAVSRFLSISNADINVAARSFLQYMC